MINFKNLRFYLITALLVVAGLILLFNKTFTIGLIVLGIAVLVFLLWELFLKEKEKQIDTLNKEIRRMRSENSTLKADVAELDNNDNYRPMAEFSKDNIYTHVIEENGDIASLSDKQRD